jgi:hypothetical protein
MQRLEVSGAVRSLYGSLGVKGLINVAKKLIFRTRSLEVIEMLGILCNDLYEKWRQKYPFSSYAN